MIKRCYDIVFTLVITLLFLWWIIPIISLLIYLMTGKPVFFIQKRTGKNGRVFNCYKFRTMVVNDQQDQIQATLGDPRITTIGHFLRETNLDELPQFLNVLKGDMSIVGPRPHMLHHTDQFTEMLHTYAHRHKVKPGITGLAQLKGYRGPTPDFKSIYKRVQYDNHYVDYNNLLLDVWITWGTAIHVIKQTISMIRPVARPN